jgi:hypothetical protein
VRWFTDNPDRPQAVLRMDGAECMLLGPGAAATQAIADLLAGRIRTETPWPDSHTESDWQHLGGRIMQLNRVSPRTLAICRQAGFRAQPGTSQPHYRAHAWYITGRPRFAERIRHACRVVNGTELLPLLCEGITEQRELEYIRACLQSGPSFVCELEGQPVSWSMTNLGGAMARIFTPEEQRGKGYASSLAALQVDTMLESQGLAAASVRIDNVGSYRIFEGLGARHIRGPLTWSNLLWPKE